MKHPTLDPKRNPPTLNVDESLDDEELFRKAMAEVEPLVGNSMEESGKKAQAAGIGLTILPRDVLEEFLKNGTPERFFEGGYVEGGPQDWNLLLVKKLRDGDFSVQAELDLHGLSQKEARLEIKGFVRSCSRKQLTCVRIIHGKGKNSRNYTSVLKQQIPVWLSQKSIARYLVAFTSARPEDGGVGAVYVLLGRRQGRKREGRRERTSSVKTA